MGFEQLIEFVKTNLSFLPSWFTDIFWHLVAAILVVYLLTIFFKAVSDAAFVGPVKSIATFSKSILKSFLSGTFKALETPIERPRTKLVVKGFAVIHSYLMCVLFFGLTLFVALIAVVAGFPKDLLKQIGSWGILLLFFYLTVFFRAEADRDWLALKKQWLVVKENPNA
jgi:hypothetical protein